VLLAAAASVAAAQAGPTVTTQYGVLQGRSGGKSDVYSSIPYAAPPVGDGRWASPRPPASWTGVRQATAGETSFSMLPQGDNAYTLQCIVSRLQTRSDAPKIVICHHTLVLQ